MDLFSLSGEWLSLLLLSEFFKFTVGVRVHMPPCKSRGQKATWCSLVSHPTLVVAAAAAVSMGLYLLFSVILIHSNRKQMMCHDRVTKYSVVMVLHIANHRN